LLQQEDGLLVQHVPLQQAKQHWPLQQVIPAGQQVALPVAPHGGSLFEVQTQAPLAQVCPVGQQPFPQGVPPGTPGEVSHWHWPP
jgi:hypothetical protein